MELFHIPAYEKVVCTAQVTIRLFSIFKHNYAATGGGLPTNGECVHASEQSKNEIGLFLTRPRWHCRLALLGNSRLYSSLSIRRTGMDWFTFSNPQDSEVTNGSFSCQNFDTPDAR